MNFANLIPVGIANAVTLAIALPNLKAQLPQTTTQPEPAVAQPTTAQRGLSSNCIATYAKAEALSL